jgi:hypothetical protein
MLTKGARVQVVSGGDPSRVQPVRLCEDATCDGWRVTELVNASGDGLRVIPVQVVESRTAQLVRILGYIVEGVSGLLLESGQALLLENGQAILPE